MAPKFLCPIMHCGPPAQSHLAILKSRDALVGARTKLINHCRGIVKSLGERLPSCSAPSFARQVRDAIPEALAFVLALEQPERFANSRAVPVYLGLTPKRDQSGDSDKQLRITKAGDLFPRRLLVSCAHYILGPFGADSDLRRWGLKLCARGGKNAKKRATVAVARKLAVLLHRLWSGAEPYDPFYHSKRHDDEDKAKQAA